jgi:CubicO group peptidase (beta-lactamase class C family)
MPMNLHSEMLRSRWRTRRFALVGLVVALHPAVSLAQDPTISLAGYDSFVNQAIKDWEVPGVAIAIVKNGEVILAAGFGMRDVASKLPVTSKTLFAIGSCTKAFTTFVMGTLVDEGKLAWDKPVRTYAPEIQLYDRAAAELLTPRDLVTHRSGLPRHDMVWYNATLSRKEIVARLPYLEPSEPIRSKFQYNNIMFMAAGYVVDSLTGMPWEEAVRKRIFEPLEMTGSNFSVKDSQKSSDFARPYEDRDDHIVPIPFRDITNAGPAGSINSNVTDMARWLIVNSQKGKIAGKQIISPAVLADIHTPHEGLSVPFEPRIKPIVFSRKPDAKLSDPEYLKKFAGEYELAGNTVRVRLEGTTMMIDRQGQGSATLVPDRDDGFNLKEQSGTSIRFVTDREGKVTEMALSTAAGVFSVKRKQP